MDTQKAIDKMNRIHSISTKITIFIIAGFLLCGMGVCVSFVMMEFVSKGASVVLVLTGILFALWAVAVVVGVPWSRNSQKTIKKLYKEVFVNGVFDEYFENVRYDWEKGLTREEVSGGDLLEVWTHFESEDRLSGDYQGVHFEQADVKSWKRVKRGDHYHDEYSIRGRFFIIDTNFKNIDSLKLFHHIMLESAMEDGKNRGNRNTQVTMESEEFNKTISVYSKDAKDAFYIFKPDVMERVLKLYSKYYNGICMHFKGQKLYVGINTMRDAFDAGNIIGTFPLRYPEERGKVKGDIQMVIDIIDTFQLVDASEKEFIDME